MALTTEQVRHVAQLARLDLGDDAIARMTRELDAIVGYVEQLAQVDTTGIDPIANVAGLVNVVRPDVPGPMLPVREVLGNAPQVNEVAFLVPKAVER